MEKPERKKIFRIFLRNLFAVLLALCTLNGNAQTTKGIIEKIKKEVEHINSVKLKLEAKCFPYKNKCGVTKAAIAMYHINSDVKMIIDTGIGDSDKAATSWNYEYYYQKGDLIFSYETRRYFNNETGNEDSEELRQYFAANRLIKQIKNGITTYPKNIFINKSDTRYRLKNITKASDIDRIYECPDL